PDTRIRSGGLIKRGRTTVAGRRVSLTSLTARNQSLILSDCVWRSCPQTGARQGLERSSTIAAPAFTPPQKSPDCGGGGDPEAPQATGRPMRLETTSTGKNLW